MLIKNAPRREYRLKDGTLVPGVTTVLDVLARPALYKWFWTGGFECGEKWCDSYYSNPDDESYKKPEFSEWRESQKDDTAGVGTIAHYKIQCYFNGEKEEYGPGWDLEHIKMAEVPFQSFLRYYHSFDYRNVILSEYSSVHENKRYGGTFDGLVDTPKGVELWDIKTSKVIYEEYYIQLAAYKMLLSQDAKWRHMRIKERVVLVTKDGRLEAPDVSKAYMERARRTWDPLIKMYHVLTDFRKQSRKAA